MAKNTMKKGLLTLLTAGAMLSNQDVKADDLRLALGSDDFSVGFRILNQKHLVGATEGFDSTYDVSPAIALAPFKFLDIHTTLNNTNLNVDARGTNSQTRFDSKFTARNSSGNTTTSTTNWVEYSFPGNSFDTNRIYISDVFVNGAFTTNGNFRKIVNVKDLNHGTNVDYVFLPKISAVPNNTDFGYANTSCVFTNQYQGMQGNKTPKTVNMSSNQVDGLEYKVISKSDSAGTATVQNGTNLVYTPGTSFTGTNNVNVQLNWVNGATTNNLGNINWQFGVTNEVYPLNATNDNVTNNLGSSNKIDMSDLIANDSDPNGHTVRFNGLVGTNSALGFPLATNATSILYNPGISNRLNDSFQYSITNDHGASGIGTVNVNVNTNVFGQNMTIVPSNNVVNGTFFGIPGFRYSPERSTNLVDWKSLTNIVANPTVKFTDTFSDLGGQAPSSAYYRMRYNP